jgi:ATP-binding cassette subfamily C protein LapB
MIFSDVGEAYGELDWFVNENRFVGAKVDLSQWEALKETLQDFGVSTPELQKIVEMCMSEMHLDTPTWMRSPAPNKLPALALVPGEGLMIIYARESDGRWRIENSRGQRELTDFAEGSLFTPLKAADRDRAKKSAREMFTEIAFEQKGIIVQAAIASLAMNVLALGTSFYSMQVYDRVIPTQGISTLTALSIGVFIAIFLEMVVKISRSVILEYASRNMDTAYSHNIFKRFLEVRSDVLPRSVGTLSAKLQSYNSVRSFITTVSLYVIIDFPFSLLFLAVITMIAGFQLSFIAFVFMVIAAIVGSMFRSKIDKLTKSSTAASNKKLGLLVETVEGAEQIKTHGSGWSFLNRWNHLTRDAINDDLSIRHYSEMSSYFAAFFQQLSYVSLVGFGAYLVATTDSLTMGGLIATTILSGRVLSPIAMLPNIFVQWGKAKIAVSDLETVYALDRDNEGVESPLSPERFSPKIECKNMRFTYGEEMAGVSVESLLIKPGERVAIVGSIGSGKSTLLKLMAGLYKPQEGSILHDGIDVQYLSRTFLSQNIGYLPQSVKLFSGTLRDNLTSGMVGLSDERVLEMCTQTGLIHLINSLPKGLDTPVPENGDNVSGGQKQIIALTRMLLGEPKAWFLDEPSASMDEGTEKALMQLLSRKMKSEDTLVLVTHKPSLLKIVDRIIFLTPKGIMLDGERDEVMQKLSARPKVKEKADV